MDVAPRAGAWIELAADYRGVAGYTSRPARARGLKHRGKQLARHVLLAAPRGRVD